VSLREVDCSLWLSRLLSISRAGNLMRLTNGGKGVIQPVVADVGFLYPESTSGTERVGRDPTCFSSAFRSSRLNPRSMSHGPYVAFLPVGNSS
jgi:hypothetical protein